MKKLNNKGAVLVLSYLVLSSLLILTAGFAISTVSELSQANRYRDTASAFWLAEAGINRFLKDTTLLDGGDINDILGAGSFLMTKVDTADERTVTVTATVNDIKREVEIVFAANPPVIFDNTMSTGGDINLIGLLAKMDVFGPTRITGTYNKSGIGASGWFEDKTEGVDSSETTLLYPDEDGSGTGDEFNDFREFYRAMTDPTHPDFADSGYTTDEVVYISNSGTEDIWPGDDLDLDGKKLVFVDGGSAGAGDVDIYFGGTWQANQNITIVSTGTVRHFQPLTVASDSQLNTVSWDDYTEASILYSTHTGVTYSHDEANLFSIFSYSETTGNLIANNGINALEALSWKKFLYGDPLDNETVPPGFQGLIAAAAPGYSSTPRANSWADKGDPDE